MLKQAHEAGFHDALARFGIKEAIAMPAPASMGQKMLGWGKNIAQGLVGSPATVGKQIYNGQAFKPEGALHWSKVFWPTVKNEAGQTNHLQTWLGRGFGSILPAYGAYRAAAGDGDPTKSRAENVLGSLGGSVAGAYAYPFVGALGAGHLARAGQALGESVGGMFGGKPQQQQQPAYPPNNYGGAY